MDEPTTGLDPQARRNLWDLVEQINNEGKTIVITTHYMDEAEVLCDRIAIMDHAKIIALDTTENLLKNTGISSTITFRYDKPCYQSHLTVLPGVNSVTNEDHGYRILTSDPKLSLGTLFEHAQECGFNIFDLNLRQPTLDDVFLKLTGHAMREESGGAKDRARFANRMWRG